MQTLTLIETYEGKNYFKNFATGRVYCQTRDGFYICTNEWEPLMDANPEAFTFTKNKAV